MDGRGVILSIKDLGFGDGLMWSVRERENFGFLSLSRCFSKLSVVY